MSGNHAQRASRWLFPENHRFYLATAIGVVAAAIYGLADSELSGGARVPVADYIMLAMALPLLAYVVLTSLVFRYGDQEDLARWAASTRAPSWVDHFVRGTAPGAGFAVAVSAIALIAVILWLPRDGGPEAMSGSARLAVSLAAVVGAWSTVLMTHAVAYLCQDHRSRAVGGAGLVFPGTVRPVWRDYLYFASSISTTFGATDVTVSRTGMRDIVRTHAIISFVFNTIILAATVSLIVSFVA